MSRQDLSIPQVSRFGEHGSDQLPCNPHINLILRGQNPCQCLIKRLP